MRFIGSVIALTIVYALALASAHPWDLAMGAGFATLVYLLFRSWIFPFSPASEPPCEVPVWRRALHVPAFVVVEIAHIIRGTWLVFLVVIGRRPIQQGIVGIPFGERRELGKVVSAYADTLAPGSVIVEIDEAEATTWVHVIDATDPEGAREAAERFYDRWQKKAFP